MDFASMMNTRLVNVEADDVAQLHEMVLRLGISDGVTQIHTSVNTLSDSLFGSEPAAFAKLIRHGEMTAGFAIYSWKWGVFTGVRDMYLNAIFVLSEFRRKGIGQAAMVELARIAIANGCTRIEWLTVREKESSRFFYESIGSQEANHMVVRRIQGAKLAALAGNAL